MMYIFGGSMGKSELRGPIAGVALQEMELLKGIAPRGGNEAVQFIT